MFKVNNKDTRTTPIALALCILFHESTTLQVADLNFVTAFSDTIGRLVTSDWAVY